MEILAHTHPLKQDMIKTAKTILEKITYMRDVKEENLLYDSENISELRITDKNLSSGRVCLQVSFHEALYYQTLSEYTKMPIRGEFQLMKMIAEFGKMKEEYQKVESALESVKGKGYGVKMKARANSIHMIRSVIETEIAPIVGSEQQAQDLISYIKTNAAKSEDGIWETNIFGKSIQQIVDDGIQTKVSQMTDECQIKLQEALQKIINDSNGGMICIII
jgi:stage IV sporulation protein A